jgi:3-oxoacyl-[acyl-carrier protein] reductase
MQKGSINVEYQQRFKGRVALVTGVAGPDGIGFAAARRLAAEGAALGIADISPLVRERGEELAAAGADVICFQEDLSRPEGPGRIAATLLDRYGRLDILLNIAGMAVMGGPGEVFKPVLELSDEEWEFSLSINLKTVLACTRACLPAMLKHHYGRIVNMSSVTGPLVANPGEAPYCVAKAGVAGFTRALALEVGREGVTVNAVAPGWISTGSSTPEEAAGGENTALGRAGTPAEVAALFAFLAAEEASYITGQLMVIDGGNIIQEYKGPSELYY